MTDQFITVFIWMDNEHAYMGDTPIPPFSWSVFANEVPTSAYLPMRIKLRKWSNSDIYQKIDIMNALIESSPKDRWFRPEELVNGEY